MPDSLQDRNTVAVDYDGVIADTNLVKSRWIRRHLHSEVPPALCNRTDCVPRIGVDQYEAMAAEVYGREATLAAPAVRGVSDALGELANTYRFILVTARTPERLAFAADWLNSHGLRSYFSELHSSAGGMAKVTIAAHYDASVLIDDDPRHLVSHPAISLQLILFSPGFHRDLDPRTGITVADTWDDIVRLLDAGSGRNR